MKVLPWWRRAACRDSDPRIFFQDTKRGGDLRYIAAKQICADCRVKKLCLDAALEEETSQIRSYGMRGGKSANERMIMLRESRAL